MTRPQGFFGTEFVSCGFGFLQYVDNSQYVVDRVMRKILELTGSLVTIAPDPLILKPELAESQAFTLADRSVKVMKTVGETLLSNGDFRAVARQMAKTQNDLFLKTLEEERESGLNVSAADYSFPDWQFGEAFDYQSYRGSDQ